MSALFSKALGAWDFLKVPSLNWKATSTLNIPLAPFTRRIVTAFHDKPSVYGHGIRQKRHFNQTSCSTNGFLPRNVWRVVFKHADILTWIPMSNNLACFRHFTLTETKSNVFAHIEKSKFAFPDYNLLLSRFPKSRKFWCATPIFTKVLGFKMVHSRLKEASLVLESTN